MWFQAHVVNPAVRAVLRSPLHGLLSGGLALLTYTGRRSGRRIVLPVQFARMDGRRLVVIPGHAEQKRWWRNFAAPTAVSVLLAGRSHEAMASAHSGASPETRAACRAYLGRFPRAAKAVDLPSATPSDDQLDGFLQVQPIVIVEMEDGRGPSDR